MGSNDWVAGYRAAVARLLMEQGEFVRIEAYPEDGEAPRWGDQPGDYDTFTVVYGWRDWSHKDKCRVVSIDQDTVRERILSTFQGTFVDNTDEVGMEVRATCQCGKYKDKWLRYTGSFGETLEILLKGSS